MLTVEAKRGETIIIPAREGRGVRLQSGQEFRCIDAEGQQCGDLFAFCVDNVREYASAEHTRVWNDTLFPWVGQVFVTNKRRPILTFVRDDTPGRHDMQIASCDPTRFELLGCEGWHPSCQENLQKVMAEFGYEDIEIPSPINLFTNIPIGPDGSMRWEPALTKAGDSVTMRTEQDAYVILTACAQDVLPINAKNPTSLALEILG